MRFCSILLLLFLHKTVSAQCDSTYADLIGNGIRDIHSFDTNRLIAVGHNGAIIHSNDGGHSWRLNKSFKSSANFHGLQFTGSQIGYTMGFLENSLYKTEDGGATWFPLYFPHFNLDGFHFLSDSKGFICSRSGSLYSTVDGGRSWKDTLIQSNLYAITFTPGKIGFIGSHRSIYKSLDEGRTWNQINLDFLSFGTDIICIKFFNELIGFAATDDGGILKTIDGGSSWSGIAPGHGGVVQDFFFYNSNIVFAAYELNLFKSINGGQSWNLINDLSLPRAFFHSIAADPLKEKIFVVGSGSSISGVFEGRIIASTRNLGTTWTNHSFNPDYDNMGIEVFNDSTALIVSGAGFILKTYDRGESWKLFNTGLVDQTQTMDFANESTGYLLDEVSLWKTTNGGANWVRLVRPPFGPHRFLRFLTETTGYYGNGHSIYKTNDGANSWQEIFTATGSFSVSNGYFFSGNKGYVVGYNGLAFQSMDNGVNWTRINLNSSRLLTSVYFYNDNIGFVGTEDTIMYKTTNGGASWDSISTGPLKYISQIKFVNNSTGYFIGGHGLGSLSEMYKTLDGGNTIKLVASISESFWDMEGFNTVYAVGDNGSIVRTDSAQKPGIPGYIVGPDSSCTNKTDIYIIPEVPGNSYTWSLSGGGTQRFAANKDTVSWNSTGLHTISVSISNKCGLSPARILPVRIIQYVPTITKTFDTVLTASPGTNYQWFENDNPIPGFMGGNSQSLIVRAAGIFKVRVTNNLGCTSISMPFNHIPTGINDPTLSNETRIYPTVAHDKLMLVIGNNYIGSVLVSYISSSGQSLKRMKLNKQSSIGTFEMQVEDLPAGVYIFQIQFRGLQTTKKFVKQ